MSQVITFGLPANFPGGFVQTITGNSGGAVAPLAGNINVVGDGTNITIVGNPGTHTLTASLTGFTNHALVLGNASGGLTSLGVASNGQIPIGSTGADAVLATLSPGTNISISNGAGSITIATSGPASFSWAVITANQTAAVNHGYICNKAGTLALALPATAVVGDLLEVTGINTALGWQITQAANQQIFFGTSSTTLGATGTLTSSATRDSVRLVCVVAGASTVWNVISSVGNITVA